MSQPPSVVDLHRSEAPRALGFAVLTVSDTRTTASDRSGPVVRELIVAAGHAVRRAAIVADEPVAIRVEVEACLADPACDAVVLTGGTGVAPRDVTPEAVRPLLDRELSGFGELFRQLSFAAIGPAAMLSRATAGVARGRALFLLPGSPAGAALAMDRLVLPEAGHLVAQARRSPGSR
jgi:molybdenum cofactor biosynthesis protein B